MKSILSQTDINHFMKLAIQEAKKAMKNDEVPIGAIIIDKDQNIIAKGYNQVQKKKNPLKHAEMIAIDKALKKTKEKYLFDASIFITLEPCPLCATAISFAKIKNIYFATTDEKGGAVVSGVKLYDTQKNLYKPNYFYGYFKQETSKILKDFFQNKRNSKTAP